MQSTIIYAPSAVEIKEKIRELIRLQQERYGQALLSVVGMELSKHFNRPFKLISSEPTLGSFIRNYMQDEVELTRKEGYPLVLYAKLKGEFFTGEVSGPSSVASEPVAPRFDPSFWAAFAKPLPVGQERFLRTERPLHFVDLPSGSAFPAGHVEVDPNFIAPEALVDRAARSQFILKQIEAWLEKNDLKAEAFLSTRSSANISYEKLETIPIVRILTRLQPADLERLVLPADLWLKLLTVKDK